MTTFADMVFAAGGIPAIAGVPFGPKAKYYFVDPTNGLDTNDGLSLESPLATLTAAEDKCVANQHDTVFYIAGSSSLSLSAKLTWDKNYTHLIGICAPTGVAQRARIFQAAGDLNLAPLIDITATGCMFKNLYIFQGTDDAQSLVNVQVTGGRNYFENVHFAGGGHATNAVDGCASLKLNGAEENTFVNCTFGVDTIAAATGVTAITMDGEAHRNIFRNCMVTLYAGDTGATFVEVVDGTGIDRYTLFDNCLFINSNSDNFAMAGAFVIPEFAANNSSRILLKDCMLHGVSKLDANDRGVLYGNMNDVTGADTSGVAVELIT